MLNTEPENQEDGKEGMEGEELRRIPLQTVKTGLHTVLRQCLAVFGLGLIVVAVPVGIVTPLLPIGLPIAIIGVVLLGRNAIWGRRWMEAMMARNPHLERFAPNWLMRVVFGREKRSAR